MNDELLKSFVKVCHEYPGNSNSLHMLGTSSKKLEIAAGNQILSVMKLFDKEVIYTSGDVEANNLVIRGFLNPNSKKRKVIVIGDVSSSIRISLEKMNDAFFINVPLKDNKVDIDFVDSILDDDVALITSKFFLNIEECFKLAKKKGIKTHVDLSNTSNLVGSDYCDFVTVYYDFIPNFGALIKNKDIVLVPLIHGGKSTSAYRSGTPALPFIVMFSKLVKLMYKNN